MAEYGIQTILLCEETRLRLVSRLKEKVNIDITLNEGLDFYEMKAYRLRNHGLDVETVLDEKEIYLDQLHNFIRKALEKALDKEPYSPRSSPYR